MAENSDVKLLSNIIDRWQEDYHIQFPRKPKPKVKLNGTQKARVIRFAVENYGVTTEQAEAAMGLWTQGVRYEAACLGVPPDVVLIELAKDFPKLFNNKDIHLLKIGIRQDLLPWAKKKGFAEEQLGKALKKWVSRKKYTRYQKQANKDGDVMRYGLNMEKCPLLPQWRVEQLKEQAEEVVTK